MRSHSIAEANKRLRIRGRSSVGLERRPVTPEVAGSSPVAPATRECRHWSGAMNELLLEYLPILIFLIIAGGLALVILGASLVLARQNPDSEKLSPYECGFEAFADARAKFDVRFYLVAILFIIFDLEVAFLFPWAVSLAHIGLFGFFSMIVFLAVLTIGFIYEWRKGALEWE
jgi:NADH-quinone oxidoreductase subunit A